MNLLQEQSVHLENNLLKKDSSKLISLKKKDKTLWQKI